MTAGKRLTFSPSFSETDQGKPQGKRVSLSYNQLTYKTDGRLANQSFWFHVDCVVAHGILKKASHREVVLEYKTQNYLVG